MIFANPMTGHWPLHGVHFFTESHYKALCEINGYELVELITPFCCGNTVDSRQVMAVIIKAKDNEFMPLDQFKVLYGLTICSS